MLARATLALAAALGGARSARALPLPPDAERPLCTPFASPPGRWVLDAADPARGEGMRWETDAEAAWAAGNTSGGAPCRWLVPDAAAFARCAAGRTVVLAGDSVQRYAWLFLSNDLTGCDAPGAPDPWAPEAQPVCPYIDAMKLAKSDGWVTIPPRTGGGAGGGGGGGGGGNVTLPYRYLRFAYEFFDKVGAMRPDYFGAPGAADAVILGGFGYWDARYGTTPILQNVFARFPADFEAALLARNPALRARLVAMSTTYAENFDGRLGMFPPERLDEANAAAGAAWRALGVPWFDTRKYTRAATPEQIAVRDRAAGRLFTLDGYHPNRRVQEAMAREWQSYVCALPPLGQDVAPAAPAAPAASSAPRARFLPFFFSAPPPSTRAGTSKASTSSASTSRPTTTAPMGRCAATGFLTTFMSVSFVSAARTRKLCSSCTMRPQKRLNVRGMRVCGSISMSTFFFVSISTRSAPALLSGESSSASST